MAQATPATKANELISRLAAATWKRQHDLELRRIQGDAEALMRVDARSAHVVLGGVAAARADVESTRNHFRIAAQLAADPAEHYQTKRNHSIALAVLELHDEAFEVVTALLEAYPDDVDLLEHAAAEAMESANFADAKVLAERRDRVAPSNLGWSADLGLMESAVEAGLFSRDGVRRLLKAVGEVQRGEGARHGSFRIISSDGGESFLYLRGVNATPSEAAAMNLSLAEFVMNDSDLASDPGVRFVAGFFSAEPHGDHP